MLKRFTILLFLLYSCIELQSQWVELNSGTTNLLFDICFTDDNNGSACGLFGTVYRTTNAGLNWVNQPTPAGPNLWGIYFPNSLTGYAAGESGALIKTTNGGTNWFSLTLPVFENLTSVFFNDADNGFISGWNGRIFKTTNGGTNWTILTTNTTQKINKVHFANLSTGFAVCDGGIIIKTTDAGQNWNPQNSGITQNIFGLFAVNIDTVYASGEDGAIVKTTNGGASWVPQISPASQRLYDIYFVNSLTGTAAGLTSTILRTTNGGALWLQQTYGVPNGADFFGTWFTGVTTGYVCGANGKILKTVTGGFPYPSQPVLVSPPNGANAVSITPTLDWDTVTTASTYKLQLATDTSYSSPVIDTSLLLNTQLTVQPGRLLNNTLYYWHVRGVNIVGDGPFSTNFRFRTIVAFPQAPNLLFPANNASNISLTPTFDWDSNSVANYYNLEASLDTSFSDPPVNYTGITQSFLSITNPPLQYNSRYYWRVNTVNDAGTSPWSQVHIFTTIFGPPSPPTLLAPPNGTVGVPLVPTMRWVEDISALNYQMQISSDSNFSSTVIDTTIADSNQCTIRAGVLINIHTYYWRVRTTNPIGTSAWSAVWSFFTLLSPPVAPVLLSPPNNAIDVSLTPTLYWDTVQYAQSYKIQLATDPSFPLSSLLINSAGLPVPHINVSGGLLNNNTDYYWRVSATNGAGTGPYSAIWKFRTVISPPVAPPTLLSPPNNSFSQSVTPTLNWNDVFGSLGYQLFVTDDSLFNTITLDTTITPSQFTIPAGVLLPTTTYYWKVRGFNIGGFGPFSLTWHFTTGLIGITQLSNVIPKDFKLYNNYPNPFNPETHIRFDIAPEYKSGVSKAEIVVYDLLGRQLDILVNTELKPGTYEVSWDASKYPSGVYLFRLNAGKYNAVKKMVLLK